MCTRLALKILYSGRYIICKLQCLRLGWNNFGNNYCKNDWKITVPATGTVRMKASAGLLHVCYCSVLSDSHMHASETIMYLRSIVSVVLVHSR